MFDIILGFIIMALALYGAVSLGLVIATRVIPSCREQRRIARKYKQVVAEARASIVVNGQGETRDTSQPPMSWASEQVLKEYNALPEESQPYGDITETLRALDTKHDRNLLNGHFYLPAYEWGTARPNGGGYSWIGASQMQVDPETGEDVRHEHHGCIGSEHYALHVAIADITKAIRDKEKALELAGVQHELQQVPSLLEALKMEAEANQP